MENRKTLIEKELKLEKKKLEEKIELLKQEKEKYGFDYDTMKKINKNNKYITFSNVLIATIGNTINPLLGYLSYPLLNIITSTLGVKIMESYYSKKNNTEDKIEFSSSIKKITSNYEKILNINYAIAKLTVKDMIIDKTIDMNNEEYRIVNKDNKNNDAKINLIALNAVANDNFLHGKELDESNKIFSKGLTLDLLGSLIINLWISHDIVFTLLLTDATMMVSIIARYLNTNINKVKTDKICKNMKEEFIKNKTKENLSSTKNIDNDHIILINSYNNNANELSKNKETYEDLVYSIIEEESYKVLDKYNKNIESIIRKRKIDEYYKKKEEIIRILNTNDNKHPEKAKENKPKVLKKIIKFENQSKK